MSKIHIPFKLLLLVLLIVIAVSIKVYDYYRLQNLEHNTAETLKISLQSLDVNAKAGAPKTVCSFNRTYTYNLPSQCTSSLAAESATTYDEAKEMLLDHQWLFVSEHLNTPSEGYGKYSYYHKSSVCLSLNDEYAHRSLRLFTGQYCNY